MCENMCFGHCLFLVDCCLHLFVSGFFFVFFCFEGGKIQSYNVCGSDVVANLQVLVYGCRVEVCRSVEKDVLGWGFLRENVSFITRVMFMLIAVLHNLL